MRIVNGADSIKENGCVTTLRASFTVVTVILRIIVMIGRKENYDGRTDG